MARNSNPVTHPIFQGPVFNEAVASGGPAGFQQPHPSDDPVNGSKVDYLEMNPAIQATGLILEKYDDRNYGYLRISANKDQLRIGFHEVTNQSILQTRYDLVTVELKTHQMVAN